MAQNPPNNRPDGDDDENNPQDPMSAMFSQLFGGSFDPNDLPPQLREAMGSQDPAAMQQMMQQAQAMMSAMMQNNASEGPVNWKLASDTALQSYAGEDPEVSDSRKSAIVDASYLADLWLNNATAFESKGEATEVWTRKRWYDKTLGVWKKVTEPVAESVTRAITSAMKDQIPEEMKGMLGNSDAMFRNLGSSMFGMQLGTALGGLAKDVLGGTDIGLPLAGTTPGLVAANVANFGEGLEIPEQEVLLYVILREHAHARLFNRVPWLSSKLIGAVESYSRGIHIDMSRVEEAVRGIDPSNPENLQELLGEGLFTPERTGQQEKALENLELTLALIEGWVDHVVSLAAANLPFAAHLRETMRRRRASGGPAESAFASLVGLELRPRKLREAAALWEHLHEERGTEGRDAIWDHPDLMPTAEDLSEPAGFTKRRESAASEYDEFDAALGKLLDGGFDKPEPEVENPEDSNPDDPKN
ncbi:zinc-dependent metalloprotease [Arthrobacter sp. MYb211]|uniref:zinc-dependent metalloprotease n=1 Tax=Micrococcaceae TaxID=1268 RepID=UPI000BB9906A|nr:MULTISPECIES: zinc-dependent metalloprotease [Micrococcaceae]PCC29475.1 zinc-dependent metalloprotease [Glutamicibacter sp. BW80]PQZ99236.1 zinc-dependent metalloprotease [Arthrobacter sp. MYb224]PRA12782.1 zinc-dependent metalloprotease [Arthrobacter sp. MYb221]PRC09698.1 zinc-dependent metalloprotease [Arthrobacter sp. MYb211]